MAEYNYQAYLGGMAPYGGSAGMVQSQIPSSGGSDMATVAPAAIGAAGSIIAGGKGAKGAKEAAEVQLKGTREALALERAKEQQRQQNYEQAMAIWSAGRKALLERYGLPLDAGGLTTGGSGAYPIGQQPAVYTWLNGVAPLDVPPTSPAANTPTQAANLRNLVTNPDFTLNNWNEWSRYGLTPPTKG